MPLIVMVGAILLSTIVAIGQNPATTHNGNAVNPVRSCRPQATDSEKIKAVLESVRDHPTAGAYNTLGVLYVQSNRVSCAIPAFDSAIKLDARDWEAHYNLGLALITKGESLRAETELKAATEQKPDSPSAHFALGTLFESERKLSEAETEFRATLAVDSHFEPAVLKLSALLSREGKPDAAVATLQEALKKASPEQQQDLQSALGLAYAQSGQSDLAMSVLRGVVAAHPDSAEAHLGLGQGYLKLQPADAQSAVVEFRQALRLNPGVDAASIALTQALLTAHRYTEALPVAQDYARRRPNDAQAFYVLGFTLKNLHRNDEAFRSFQRATRLDARDFDSRFQLGLVLAEMGNNTQAIKALQAAETLNPADAETHAQLVRLFKKVGDETRARAEEERVSRLEKARRKEVHLSKLTERGDQYLTAGNAKAAAESYKEALELNPGDASLHYDLALALDKLNDQVAERKELNRAITLDAALAVTQNQLGLLDLEQNQTAEAELHFKKALEIDPHFAEAQNSLGVVYSQSGRNEEAAAMFEQAMSNAKNFAKPHLNLGLLLAQHGNFAEAEQQFRSAIEIEPGFTDAYAALGMLQAKTGRGAEGLKSFKKAVELEPQSAQAHLNLAIALVDQFDRNAALREFSEAVRLGPNLAAAHYNLGRFYFESGKYEDANEQLELALKLDPSHADALYFLALTAKQRGEPERSAEFLQRLVMLQPENADAQYLLGQHLEHAGQTGEAIRHWKAAVQADPNHLQALFNLAKTLSQTGDPDAKQYEERVDSLRKKQQITDRVSELGNFALEAANAQNWPQAFAQMNEAVQLCGDCPEKAHLHKNLGFFYERTGNIAEATRELRIVLQLAPGDSDAQSALAAIQRVQDGAD